MCFFILHTQKFRGGHEQVIYTRLFAHDCHFILAGSNIINQKINNL
jgi:hypothetical protein